MRFLKKLLLYLFVSHLLYIFICRWINPPITLTQIGSLLQGNGLKRDMISFDKMGSNIKLAVIAGEDQLFPDHNGFDMKSIKKAMAHNEKHPGRRRGASTISQQVAKNVFLWQGGGYVRKGLEVYFTFMIETFWSKERILQTYLNVAEMGTGIFGAQAAAKSYFKKDALNLTKAEASQIAACLPNPKKFTVKPLSKYVSVRSNFIQRQMNAIQGDKDIKGIIN